MSDKKDYAAIVRKDWNDLDTPAKQELKFMLLFTDKFADFERLDANKQKFFLHLAEKMLFDEHRGVPSGAAIKKVLKDFPAEVTRAVCKVIKPKAYDVLWDGGTTTYTYSKTKGARQTRKELNATIKRISSHIKACSESRFYPTVVLEPLQEALALATAYRDFLDTEINAKSRYKPDGSEYKSITSRTEWNPIIKQLVETMKKALTGREVGEYGRYDYYTLSAKLLEVTYPWCWGKLGHAKATQTVRERYERITA
ncbi:hypothetical protein LPW11_16415 [Geomonas sp. RF6]|uniref:hypothetical protein n=1 Tax=Geomonas sp. RF6 TaxID=2897342 RepID=UPI001E51E2F9|nr:hypothetical protein [Geomonas sp. RF6]UFS69471.1 hypothetical protein LPW11_16415 [Geomonas sp. RF6]